MLSWLSDRSRAVHDAIWPGPSMSICARAWEYRLVSHWWWAFVVIVGRKHCERSWQWHRDERDPWDVRW